MTTTLFEAMSRLKAVHTASDRRAPAARRARLRRKLSGPVTDADVRTYAEAGIVHARRADQHDPCRYCDGTGSHFRENEVGYQVAEDCWCTELDRACRSLTAARIPGGFADAVLAALSPDTPGGTETDTDRSTATPWTAPRGLFAALDIVLAWQGGEAWSAAFIGAGTGTGKSRCAAMCARYAALNGRSSRWVSWGGFVDQVMASYNGNGPTTRRGIVAAHAAPGLLVVDDVMDRGEHAQTMAFDLFNARYEANRPTIITSNLKPQDLAIALGPRVIDRLGEMMGPPIEIDGTAYRQRKRGRA